jgi:DNA-binding GntR family transcriptional regulator
LKGSFNSFKLDRETGEPLHRQIYEFLQRAIVQGDFPPGWQLPSTRALARRLRVSRNTVLNAYEALSMEGCIASQAGSGTRVRQGDHAQPVKTLNVRRMLRESHYPAEALPLVDQDGNLVYIHR